MNETANVGFAQSGRQDVIMFCSCIRPSAAEQKFESGAGYKATIHSTQALLGIAGASNNPLHADAGVSELDIMKKGYFVAQSMRIANQSPRLLIFAISTPKSRFWRLGDAFEVRKAASSVGFAGEHSVACRPLAGL